MDTKGLYDKYSVTRTDGKPVKRTFVIEIDKDPLAHELLRAIASVYIERGGADRALLVEDLLTLSAERTPKKERTWER